MKPRMTDDRAARVLVVDDYQPFRRLIRTILRSPSVEIIGEASDGLEAIQKSAELQPDLILLDIGLPQLNGIEAAKRISKVAPHSKILFVSQVTSSDIVQAALGLGAGYVYKSRLQTDLLPAIESVQQSVDSAPDVPDLTDKGKVQTPNRPTPYRFEFDFTNSILQGRFEGFVNEQEVRNYYRAAVTHVARLSPRSYVVDVSGVTSTTVLTDTILEFAKLPPVLPDPQRPRFIVASSDAAFSLMCMYKLAREAVRPNLHVVHEHAEVWTILGIREPRFKPLPDHVHGEASHTPD